MFKVIDKETILKAIKEFNRRFHADIKLLGINKEEFTVLFEGHLCFTCGTYDYFEDFAYILKEIANLDYAVKEYKQESGKYIVTYAPKEKVKATKRHIVIEFYL